MQIANPIRVRRFKKADWETDFLFMAVLLVLAFDEG
jgi:hypothetical protein